MLSYIITYYFIYIINVGCDIDILMPEKDGREGSGVASRVSRNPTPSSAIYPCSGSGTPNLSRPASSRVNTAASRRVSIMSLDSLSSVLYFMYDQSLKPTK